METIVENSEELIQECSKCSKPKLEDSEYCQAHHNDLHRNCHYCDEEYCKEDMRQTDNGWLCENCYNDNHSTCERCEDIIHDDECQSVDCSRGSQTWCNNCIDNHASECNDCGDMCDEYTMNQTYNGRNICNSHIDDYMHCDDCGNLVHYDSADESGDNTYCPSCSEMNRSKIIKSYGYKPIPKFFGKGDLFFGIELEVEKHESNIDRSEMAQSIENDIWYFKSDGSLTNGFEIVTQPISPDYINENRQIFSESLTKLSKAGYKSYEAETCGMHIHLSKKAFGTWHLYRFMKFFIDNKNFIVSISQRKMEQLDRWATIENESDGNLVYKAKNKSGNSKRYLAINLQNDDTVEIRVFRGTLKISSFFKNIEFALALFNFSRDEKDMTIDGFKDYISKSNEYSLLKKFIKDKNL